MEAVASQHLVEALTGGPETRAEGEAAAAAAAAHLLESCAPPGAEGGDDFAAPSPGPGDLSAALHEVFADCASVVVFDAEGTVLGGTGGECAPADLAAIPAMFEDRSAAIRGGLVLGGQLYEVHRWHPPLIYGRTAAARTEDSEGVAVCQVASRSCEPSRYALVTYGYPHVSARVVPTLVDFCVQFLGLPPPEWPGAHKGGGI